MAYAAADLRVDAPCKSSSNDGDVTHGVMLQGLDADVGTVAQNSIAACSPTQLLEAFPSLLTVHDLVRPCLAAKHLAVDAIRLY